MPTIRDLAASLRDLAFLTLQLAKVGAVAAGGYVMIFAWFLVT